MRRVLWSGVLLSALFLGWLWLPHSLPVTPVNFELTPGRSFRAVAHDLADQGLLSLPQLFALLGRVDPRSSQLRAGSYAIDHPISPFELYQMLFRGLARQHQVTLIEGHTMEQLRAVLQHEDSLRHELQTLPDEALLPMLGEQQAVPVEFPRVEGLFFPDTYFYTVGSSDLAVLKRAAQAMQRRLAQVWQERAPGLPLKSSYEALILASLVERETARPDERPLIAGVFYNRLRLGMRLQTDPTVIYGLGPRYDGHLHHRDLTADTPWNTYTRSGLPPTPIGLVSLAALQAVTHPAPTRALYFVARGNGSHQFSDTLEEHEQAVDAYIHRQPKEGS